MIDYGDLAQAFQARHLAVAMEDAVAFSPDTPVSEARSRFLEDNYDQAPVVDHGNVVGFVLTRQLPETQPRDPIGQFQTEIAPGNIVSADAPVSSLLEWIIGPGVLFVIDGREIMGFVTVSDFNKQPARAYLYMLLATVEIGLADRVRHRFAEDQEQLLGLLSVADREAIEERRGLDRQVDAEGDVVSYLDFSHVIAVVGKDMALRSALGYSSRNAWQGDAGSLVDLRNEVMHPVRTIVSGKGGLVRLQGQERRLRQIGAAIKSAELAASA